MQLNSKKRVLYSRPRSSQNSLAKKVVKNIQPKISKNNYFYIKWFTNNGHIKMKKSVNINI